MWRKKEKEKSERKSRTTRGRRKSTSTGNENGARERWWKGWQDSEKGAEKIRSATIPRVTSSTYFQVNDNYYPGRTCAAVRRPQLPQIIALFIRRWMNPRSVSPFGKHRVFRRFCDVRSFEISPKRGGKKRERLLGGARIITRRLETFGFIILYQSTVRRNNIGRFHPLFA